DCKVAEELAAGNVGRSVGRSRVVERHEHGGRAAVIGALAIEAKAAGQVEANLEVVEVGAPEGLALRDGPGDAVVDGRVAVEYGVPANHRPLDVPPLLVPAGIGRP